jgi:hypothetical protein
MLEGPGSLDVGNDEARGFLLDAGPEPALRPSLINFERMKV